jgi:hypothetical protein
MASIPVHVFARTCAVVSCSMALSDAACQYMQREEGSAAADWLEDGWDRERSGRMAVVGACLSAPVSQLQHVALERLLPGTGGKAVLGKVVGGAALAPLTLSANFTAVTLLQGESLERARRKIEADMGTTWLTGACYWPFVMALTYRLVPLPHRAVASTAFGSVWHVYLSAQANKEPDMRSFEEQIRGFADKLEHWAVSQSQ